MRLTVSCVCFDTDKIWMASNEFNSLFSYSMSSGDITHILDFDIVDEKKINGIKSIIKYKDSLLLFPIHSNVAWIYAEKEHRLVRRKYGTNHTNYLKAVVLDVDACWVLPTSFSVPIIKINLDTWEVKEYLWENNNWNSYDKDSFTECIRYNNYILFISRTIGKIALFIITMTDFSVRCLKLPFFTNIGCAPLVIKDHIWVLGRKKDNKTQLCELDINGKVLSCIDLEGVILYTSDVGIIFYKMVYFENSIYLLPVHKSCIIKIDIRKHSVKRIFPWNDFLEFKNDFECWIYDYIQINDVLYLFSDKYPYLSKLNMKTDLVSTTELRCDWKYSLKEYMRRKNIVVLQENECIRFDDYIEVLYGEQK